MDFFRKNLEHFFNFMKYVSERLLCIIIILSIIALVTFFFFKNAVIITPTSFESQEILFYGVSLGNLSAWFGGIAIIITAIWSMYQFVKGRTIKQQEKAAEIAQDFANNLIEKLGIISDVLLPNQEIEKMISKIVKSKQLSQFTTIEISSILDDEKCFENCNNIIHSKETQERYNNILKERYNDEEKKKFDSYFPLLVENTLNHLEAICISISSHAAGSQFIYNSLHQSFLNAVEVLSIKISSNNSNNVDKYYTNIIEVYNMWNTQKTKDIEKLNTTNRKISKLDSKAKKEIYKLLNKKSRTV